MSNFKDKTGGFLGLKNVTHMRTDPFGFLLGLAKDQGGIAFFRFGPLADFYLVTDSEYIRQILVTQWTKTIRWERLTRASNNVTTFNIAFLDGEIWKSQRKLLTPAFHTQRVQSYLDMIECHTVHMLTGWRSGQVYEMKATMTGLTMGIIGEVLFNIADMQRDAASLSQAIDRLLMQFVDDSGALFPLPKWLPTKRHQEERAAKTTVMTYLDGLIRERRAQGEDHGDVLSALILARDAETGQSLTDAQIRDELYALFVAGHETTALWLTWALYLLAAHPNVQEQLYAEIVTSGDTNPLLDCVLKETLRMYPPAWSLFMRRVIEDIQLGDHTIPRSGVIYISPYVQHHLPQYWAAPDRFDPSRFAGDWKTKQPTYAYLPFGGGPRVCLGAYMAEVEAKVTLTTIIRAYAVSLAEDKPEIHMNPGFTLRPYPALPLSVQQRPRARN